MDTSPEYIKMCDCEEIQSQRDIGGWIDGDFIGEWKFSQNHTFVHCRVNDAWADVPPWIKHRTEWGWLPRQDQLQEMCWADYVSNRPGLNFLIYKREPFNGILMDVFWKFACSCVNAVLTPDDYKWSMEQLWLAFVMKEKFNKSWDGEKWE